MRCIETSADLEEGAAWLTRVEPRFGAVLKQVGALPLRRKPEGFAALLDAIVSQQVSTASAAAIWARVQEAGYADPQILRGATDEELAATGLSRAKIRYARALAEADLPYADLHGLPDGEVIAILTEVPGIGRWSAEIYALQSLGRRDIMAASDLALRESARLVFDLPERPGEAALRALAAPWSPWRAVAARALWAYYRVAKNREGIR